MCRMRPFRDSTILSPVVARSLEARRRWHLPVLAHRVVITIALASASGVAAESVHQFFHLRSGWNAESLAVEPDPDDAESLFNQLSGQSVWTMWEPVQRRSGSIGQSDVDRELLPDACWRDFAPTQSRVCN